MAITPKQKKALSTMLVTVVIAAIFLSGTFAWQSISQEVTNEKAGLSNPGGRLHDDFNGENKDVYVENFTDPDQDGVPIFARIRLKEYMEIGIGAGDKDAAGRKVRIIGKKDSQLGDTSTWSIYKYGGKLTAEQSEYRDFWNLYWGGVQRTCPRLIRIKIV